MHYLCVCLLFSLIQHHLNAIHLNKKKDLIYQPAQYKYSIKFLERII